MKKYVFFLVMLIPFLQFCERPKGGLGTDCEGYDKGVAAMNLQLIKTDAYNNVETVFYRLGHWQSCECNENFKMPLSVYDTLMVAGYVTDTVLWSRYSPYLFKVTDGSTPSDYVPFVFLYVGDTGNYYGNQLPDSTKHTIYEKINANKGKKIYVKDIFAMEWTRDYYPYEIIPGKGFGDAGPDFVVPLIFIRSEESIHFEK